MTKRMVFCTKLGREAEGLDAPPFGDSLGAQIFDSVSAEAWRMWKEEMMIKVINEYRLNLSDDKDYQVLIGQMQAFLNLPSEGESGAQCLEVENAERGRSGE